MPAVLLIQPPVRDFYLTRQRTVPHGLACLAGALLETGFSTEILDALASGKARELPWPETMAHLRPHYGRPDRSPFALFQRYQHFGSSFAHIGAAARASGAWLVGISSLFSAYHEEALQTAAAVRAAHPGCRIVLGGHHPSAFPEEVLGSHAVDFVIRGEGEEALPQLARALQGGPPLESVPGLVWRGEHGELRRNPPATGDLEARPLPATHLLRTRGRPRAVVVTSRGCPLRCSYCSLGASSTLFPYRRRAVSSVLAELEREVGERAVRFIDFEDENLSLERDWFLELLHGIVTRFTGQPLELRAMNGLLPATLDGEVVRAMREAGFSRLDLSLGSSSAAQLRRFRRPDQRAGFDRALALAEQNGLPAVGYLVAGAPGQEPADSVEDLLYLAARRVLVGLSIFYPSPGSADWQRCAEAGRLPAEPSLWRSSALPLEGATSRGQAAPLLRLARLLNYMKALLDAGRPLPEPAPLAETRLDATDPLSGLRLLAAFLDDAQIRGLTPAGEVYLHSTDGGLCRQFLDGLAGLELRGGGHRRPALS
jgi:hypothetical protein